MTRRALLAAVGLMLLTGCATGPAPEEAGLDTTAYGLTSQVELTDVPFHPQDAYQCGPAALATMMNVAGVDTDADALKPEVYLPARQGSLQPELRSASRRQGLVPYPLEPDFGDLLQELAAGNPVLVLQNLALEAYPVWHYAVTVGYDLEAQEMILRSGTTRRETVSFRRFLRTWRGGDHWAMTLHPPGEFPATVDADTYLRAVAPLENVAPDAAQTSYEQAARRWPAHAIPHLGLGNLAYARTAYTDAESHYRQGLERDPEVTALHHNLAWSLLQQGKDEAGLKHARQAAALAGTGDSHYYTALEAALGHR